MSMSDTKGRHKILKPVWFFSLVGTFVALTLGFQNCSGFEFDEEAWGGLSSVLPDGPAPGNGLVPLADSAGEESVMYSYEALGNLVIDKDLLFLSYPRLFEQEPVQIYWDHYIILEEGNMSFCAQRSPEDNLWQVYLNCEQTGVLHLQLTLIFEEGGEDYNYTASVAILGEVLTPPDPNQPTPNDPTPLTGAELYNMNCAGCHGVLSATNKPNRTAAAIQNAIDMNTGNMGFLSSLSPDEIRLISEALAR